MTDQRKHPLCIAIVTPMLSGMFYSELVLNLIQLCELKRHRVKIFRTGSMGEYSSMLGLEDVDVIILLRNAAHLNWVRKVKEQGKAVVSISYDYFPLDIPLITNDHIFAVKLALDTLKDQGSSRYAFIGNLHSFDTRKRYEAYCDYLELHGLEVDEEDVYICTDDLVTGGYASAAQFLERKSSATGIVCGTAMNAIGFTQHIRSVNPQLAESLSVIAFDAHSMVPVSNPGIMTLDRNLNLLAHKAITVGESIKNGDWVEQKHLIKAKLIARQDATFDTPGAYVAISPEKDSLSDPNYMKCVIYNEQEWVDVIVKGKLDPIMMLRPLFKNDLEVVSFGRFVNGGSNRQYFKVLKVVQPDKAYACSPQHKESLCEVTKYPKDLPQTEFRHFEKQLHFVICRDGECWGALSVYSNYGKEKGGSLIALVNYLEWIVASISPGSHYQSVVKKDSSDALNSASAKKVQGRLTWNMNENFIEWDDNALAILGFESALDKGVYRNMEIYDRLLESEMPTVRECLIHADTTAFSIQIHLRNRDRHYGMYDLSCAGGITDGVVELTLKGV